MALSVRDTPELRPTLVTWCERHTRTQTNLCHSVYETPQNSNQPLSLNVRDRQKQKQNFVTQCKVQINTDQDIPLSVRDRQEHRITQAT